MPRQIVILRPCSWSKPVNASDAHFPVTFSSVCGEVEVGANVCNCSFFGAMRHAIWGQQRIQPSAYLPPCRMMTMRR